MAHELVLLPNYDLTLEIVPNPSKYAYFPFLRGVDEHHFQLQHQDAPAPKSQRPPKITQCNPPIQDKLQGSHTIDSSRYSILFVLNLNQFPEHRFTDSAMFSKITSLFLNNLLFLAFQIHTPNASKPNHSKVVNNDSPFITQTLKLI